MKMRKLANYQLYSAPRRHIRNRMQSNDIQFLNRTEIESSALYFDKYLKQMKLQ